MRIGIFGDSFVDKTCDTWAHKLRTNHGHDVHVFGEGGSSLLWSARLIDQHWAEFELIIWAVTNPGRLSIHDGTRYLHFCNFDVAVDNPVVDTQRKVYKEYRKFVFDWQDECWQWNHVIRSMMITCGNLLIVPCFYEPLKVDTHLYGISELEAQVYFPRRQLMDIYQEWQDMRPGHISNRSHEILAKDINAKLSPGIYTIDYDMFTMPTETREHYWRRL